MTLNDHEIYRYPRETNGLFVSEPPDSLIIYYQPPSDDLKYRELLDIYLKEIVTRFGISPDLLDSGKERNED